MVLMALIGASAWAAFASFSGIPVSISHSLVGGLLGVGIVAAGFRIILFSGIKKIVLAMVFSPILGFWGGLFLVVLLSWIFKKSSPRKIHVQFKRVQVLTTVWVSFSHGMNDAQSAMGVITMALVSYGALATFKVPLWVMIACAFAMALGTSLGGWRVVKTMGVKMLKLQPLHGVSAEVSASGVISGMSLLGIPISTTHVVATAIMGSGSSQKLSAVRWGIVKNIVIAWIITIPVSGLIAAFLYLIVKIFS